MDKIKINPAALYENDELMAGTITEARHAKFTAELQQQGFVLSAGEEAYYHPKHWESGIGTFGPGDPGDTWIYSACFRALTPEAHAYLTE